MILNFDATTILLWIYDAIKFFDRITLLWIQNTLRNPICDSLFKFITHLGDNGYFWIGLSLILCIFKKTRKAGIFALVALLFSVIVNNAILKNVIGRIRPYEIITELECLIQHAHDASFPSGHTGSSFAAATVYLLKLPKKISIPTLIMAILISLSRLYVGIHYPTDVIAGAISGIALGILACVIGEFVIKKWLEKHPKKVKVEEQTESIETDK